MKKAIILLFVWLIVYSLNVNADQTLNFESGLEGFTVNYPSNNYALYGSVTDYCYFSHTGACSMRFKTNSSSIYNNLQIWANTSLNGYYTNVSFWAYKDCEVTVNNVNDDFFRSFWDGVNIGNSTSNAIYLRGMPCDTWVFYSGYFKDNSAYNSLGFLVNYGFAYSYGGASSYYIDDITVYNNTVETTTTTTTTTTEESTTTTTLLTAFQLKCVRVNNCSGVDCIVNATEGNTTNCYSEDCYVNFSLIVNPANLSYFDYAASYYGNGTTIDLGSVFPITINASDYFVWIETYFMETGQDIDLTGCFNSTTTTTTLSGTTTTTLSGTTTTIKGTTTTTSGITTLPPGATTTIPNNVSTGLDTGLGDTEGIATGFIFVLFVFALYTLIRAGVGSK